MAGPAGHQQGRCPPPDRDMLYMNRGSSADGIWLGFDLVTYDLLPTFGGMSGGALGASPDWS